MRENEPSLTAMFVAFARGIGTRGEAPDPLASNLVPSPFAEVLSGIERTARLRPALRPWARGLSFGLIDHITLRTRAIDRALRSALARGVDQVVILGAGLDARAWRMPELAAVDVYEVDHPASQAYKRDRVDRLHPLAQRVRFVSCNFERERLDDALEAAGHDRARPTFWIWEGVTMYLQRPSVAASLGVMDARSAPASGLAVSYVLPEYVPVGNEPLKAVVHAAFRVFGEPLVGGMEAAEMASLLEGAGFQCIDDTDSSDWAREEGTAAALPLLFRAERLAVAVR